ncbi:TPA: radical SAM protein [Aeromonas hydrophila]|uniref:B12-binding domain-containing radical SAM protein n=1 Tax=Aeromonas hydrophila TaxID=644 RepID=UPI000FD1720E|nr:radical SAM protein [Aeromonas hydrophila]AZU46125.1 hypothetical protein C3B79_0300 [Aeromonas hydrophila]MCV3293347.1 radical SAM protein [Aeromonas hydrophila]QBX69529.1 radical SAM protein [Aeromonas hydrophila]QBX74260.1 radical SAM protein [Aeromonas hydrophila]WDA24640.1 radical SAM protein [Aeromonas hydrophila]
MKIFLSNPPWYHKPTAKAPGWHGVRAGSRWPHTFPYYSHTDENGTISELQNSYKPFPFWLATATSMLNELPGFEVELRDSIALSESYMAFYDAFCVSHPDILVLETASATLDHDLEIIAQLKEFNADLTVVLTGLHIELDSPDFLKKHVGIDYIVYGEYELSLVSLLEALRDKKTLSDVPGLLYRNDDGSVVKNAFSVGKSVTDFPWPYRDPVVALAYNDTASGLPMPQLQIMATRGCPYGCIFCIWPQMFYRSGKYRKRTVEDVVDEIEHNMKTGHYASFYLDDDTFNINSRFVIELSQEIKKRGLNNYPWGAMGRADLIDQAQVDALKEAGLYSVKYGVESADQTVLNSSGKHIDINKVIRGIELTHNAGIKVHLTFTIGLPNDTHDTINQTIDLACSLPCESVQFSIATPYPGTSMYDIYKDKDWLVSDKWSDYVGSTKAVSKTDTLTPEDLEHYQKLAMSRYAEADARRKVTEDKFISNLKERLAVIGNDGRPILLFQSARVSFTKALLTTLLNLGHNVHVLCHERFCDEFRALIKDSQLHSFSKSSNFDFMQLKDLCENLSGHFCGALIPYSHRFGSGYTEVEKMALVATGKIIAGVNLDGEFIK